MNAQHQRGGGMRRRRTKPGHATSSAAAAPLAMSPRARQNASAVPQAAPRAGAWRPPGAPRSHATHAGRRPPALHPNASGRRRRAPTIHHGARAPRPRAAQRRKRARAGPRACEHELRGQPILPVSGCAGIPCRSRAPSGAFARQAFSLSSPRRTQVFTVPSAGACGCQRRIATSRRERERDRLAAAAPRAPAGSARARWHRRALQLGKRPGLSLGALSITLRPRDHLETRLAPQSRQRLRTMLVIQVMGATARAVAVRGGSQS